MRPLQKRLSKEQRQALFQIPAMLIISAAPFYVASHIFPSLLYASLMLEYVGVILFVSGHSMPQATLRFINWFRKEKL